MRLILLSTTIRKESKFGVEKFPSDSLRKLVSLLISLVTHNFTMCRSTTILNSMKSKQCMYLHNNIVLFFTLQIIPTV